MLGHVGLYSFSPHYKVVHLKTAFFVIAQIIFVIYMIYTLPTKSL